MTTTIKKKIAYITGSRADFGLMIPVLKAIEESGILSLKIYATGMHLLPFFGETVKEVEKVFPDVGRIEATIEDDTPSGQAVFAGALLSKVVDVFTKDRPDFVLLLGDRVEMLVVAIAARYLGIPTGHLHGGERSTTVDDSARHAISRLSSLHLAATHTSAERLKRAGEDEWRIHIVGAPALDTILHAALPEKETACGRLGIDPSRPFILVLQHPVSEEAEQAGKQMRETLEAVKALDLQTVVVYPNSDTGSGAMIAEIEKEKNNPFFHIFRSLAYIDFLSLVRFASVWVGNSSAALIESASFGVPVVNVGTRQTGRERGANVSDAGCDRKEIALAITRALAAGRFSAAVHNPYGDGKAAERVVRVLENLPPDAKLLAKQIAF